jgi:hypothetical protein
MNAKDEIKFLKQENECLKKQIELLKLLDLQLKCKDTPTIIPWPIVDPCPDPRDKMPYWYRHEIHCDTL